jgi:proteasome accessory factor B
MPKQREVFTRPPMERMMRIHRIIENKEYPNSKQLARELEVSFRTIKRDLVFMRNRLNLPMEFDVKRNGHYFTEPVPTFPQVPMTEREMWHLFIASQAIEQYRGTPLRSALEATFRKLAGQLDDSFRFSVGGMERILSIQPFAPGNVESKTFELLTTAVRERRAVKFRYRNRGQLKWEHRHVHPYHVGYVNNKWTLFGFDVKRDETRYYILARLSNPRLTDQRFEMARPFDLKDELRGSFGLFKGKEKIDVVIEFDAWGADDVRPQHWHWSEELTELPKGRLRVKFTLSSLEEVEKWILSFGTHATVIEPKELRERIEKIGEELAQQYG